MTTHPMVERAARALARNEVSGAYDEFGGIYRTDARAALQAAFNLSGPEITTLAYQVGVSLADVAGLVAELHQRAVANVSLKAQDDSGDAQ